ncbi:MAG: hypothetical protein JNK04_00430 [Myxococcales bacterium]|nr:hypothetical protein [Myxococcales bacterium]
MAVIGVEWGEQRGEGYVLACHLRDAASQSALLAALRMFAAVTPSLEGEMLTHAWCQAHAAAQRPSGRSNDGWEQATGIDAIWFDLPVPPGASVTTLVRATYSSFVPGALASWIAAKGGGATVLLGNRKAKRTGGLTLRVWSRETKRTELASLIRSVAEPFGDTVVSIEGMGPSGEVDATVAGEKAPEAAKALARALVNEADLAMIATSGFDATWKAFDIESLIAIPVAS